MIEVRDLYDYSHIRGLTEATMWVAHAERPTLVLGGSQSVDVVSSSLPTSATLRRRRGGGGLVLLRPKDIWVDWWIPTDDSRWAHDVHTSSIGAGNWWADTLRDVAKGEIGVHQGSLSGELAFRPVCFAGQGPGEVFVDGRKAVGLTQWRVREGVFLSTVLPREETSDVVEYLAVVPEGLAEALEQRTLSSLPIDNASALVDRLAELSGPWVRRDVSLTD